LTQSIGSTPDREKSIRKERAKASSIGKSLIQRNDCRACGQRSQQGGAPRTVRNMPAHFLSTA
jgi:hypothetical protein